MRTVLLCLVLATAASAADGWTGAEVWKKAATAPGYAAASAHEPHYDDKALWPTLTGKEPFAAERWAKARLLVWAHPGTSASHKKKELDPGDPANWLEDGKPATSLFDENTDVLLPASDTPYRLDLVGIQGQVFRHLTIGSGAHYHGGGDAIGRIHHGNIWIKRGGRLYCGAANQFVGTRHQFIRNDNDASMNSEKADYTMAAQYYFFLKQGQGSVEFLGDLTCLDEFKVHSTHVVVGVDSRVRPGRNASPFLEKGSSLALLDGAWFGSWSNTFQSSDLRIQDSTVSGGTAERPLRRPAIWAIHFKNHTDARYTGPGADTKGDKPLVYARVAGAHALGASRIVSHSAAPGAMLRVVVNTEASSNVRPPPGGGAEKVLKTNPAAAQRFAWYDALPRGIDLFLDKDVEVRGVVFCDLRAGGLLMPDPAAVQRFQDVTFAPSCAAGPRATAVASVGKGGTY